MVMLHRNATITCRVTAKPLTNITWLLDGNELSDTAGRFEIHTITGNCNLIEHSSECLQSVTLNIIDFVPVDSGTYSCSASNFAGNETQSTSLMYSGMIIAVLYLIFS